jgi:hypothetical protein
MEIVFDSILRLSDTSTILLPTIHQIWPFIVNKLKDIEGILNSRNTEQLKFSNTLIISDCLNEKFGDDRAKYLHICAPIFNLFSLFAIVSGNFMILKFQDDLIPMTIKILKYFQRLIVSKKKENKINRSSCLISNNHELGTYSNDSLPIPTITHHPSLTSSVEIKVQLSILQFLANSCKVSGLERILKPNTGLLVWNCFQFLLSFQVSIFFYRKYHSQINFYKNLERKNSRASIYSFDLYIPIQFRSL